MDIIIEKRDNACFVRPAGEIDAVTCTVLAERMNELIETGATRLLLDLEKVRHISSAGLRVMLQIAQRLRDDGRFVVLCSNESVRHILDVAGFTKIIDMHDSTENAETALRRGKVS
ncbi:MAG: STAS domain-containing protein [Deltaproteobacteria bacterium]|nr:STAS domain-containing protein [Deltaproteobacteria bacterium]